MKNTFSKFIKNIRTKKHLTLRDVEKITGISNSYLSQLEGSASRKPTVTIIKRLAEAYNCPFHQLADLVVIDSPNSAKSQFVKWEIKTKASPNVDYVIKQYLKLSNNGQKDLSEYLEFLLKKEKNKK